MTQTPKPEERARHIRIFIRDYLDSAEVRQNTPSNILHNEQFKDVLEAALIAFSAHAQGVLEGQELERERGREVVEAANVAVRALAKCSDAMRLKDGKLVLVPGADPYAIISAVNDAYHRLHGPVAAALSTQQPTPER